MYFEGTYRHIGTIDPEPLARVVASFGEDAWFEHDTRQRTFDPHRKTQTIPLLYDDDARHTNPTAWPRLAEIQPVLDPVLDLISAANPPVSGSGAEGYFIRILLTRLRPHGWILSHRDAGGTLLRSHRNHLAIVTNEQVEFEVGEDVRHLAPGEIWEINNREEHAVRNKSDQARIHMILDYVVPGEQINDPEGPCIA